MSEASAFAAYGPAGLSVAALPVPAGSRRRLAHGLVLGKFVQAAEPGFEVLREERAAQSVFELRIAEPGAPTSTVVRP